MSQSCTPIRSTSDGFLVTLRNAREVVVTDADFEQCRGAAVAPGRNLCGQQCRFCSGFKDSEYGKRG